jgi:hypothetical protein
MQNQYYNIIKNYIMQKSNLLKKENIQDFIFNYIYYPISYILTIIHYYYNKITNQFILLLLLYLPDFIFKFLNIKFKKSYIINITNCKIWNNYNNNINNKLIFYLNWWYNDGFIDLQDLNKLNIVTHFSIIINDIYIYVNLNNKTYNKKNNENSEDNFKEISFWLLPIELN